MKTDYLAANEHSFFDQSSAQYPTVAENYHVTGFCAGSLAAAVISSSASVSDVVRLGVIAVRLALLVGIQAARASSLLKAGALQASSISTTWSYIFSDTLLPCEKAQSMLSTYIQEKVRRYSDFALKVQHR